MLTRPAVEAGEHLGFLPGDLMAKVDPYLRPLYDALYDMVGPEGAQRLIANGTIEVAPLAFMRGRTLNDSFIILDEAQNTTPEQMKMFLTRIGFNSKAVVTGDVTQIDLNGQAQRPGDASRRSSATIEGISFVHLSAKDVVRHRIVADIVAAYEQQTAMTSTSTPPTSSTTTRSTSSAGCALARGALTDEGVRGLAEVSLIFADEPAIAALNQQFMGKEGPTDVLSFPIDNEPEPSGRVPRRRRQRSGRAADSPRSPS